MTLTHFLNVIVPQFITSVVIVYGFACLLIPVMEESDRAKREGTL